MSLHRYAAKRDANERECKICGGKLKSYQKTYCSISCSTSNLSGSNNPNYRNAALRRCEVCGNDYKSYNKTRKYCSLQCAGKRDYNLNKLRLMSKLPRKPKVKNGRKKKDLVCVVCGSKFQRTRKTQACSRKCANKLISLKVTRNHKPNRKCLNCGYEFYSSPSVKRKFCSYKCSRDYGTPITAGMAASNKNRMRRSYKKDANHDEIVKFMTDAGLCVLDLSPMGNGMPDLAVFTANAWHLIEIKNPATSYGKKGLNKIQMQWAKNWKGGKVHIVSNLEEARMVIEGNLSQLRQFP